MIARFTTRSRPAAGFTIAEVCVAIAVSVFFAVAAFATNQRLLIALKSQKETVAANTLLQERMERFRTLAYSSLTTPSYVQSFLYSQPYTAEGAAEAAAESPLGGLTETITVQGDLLATGVNTPPSPNSFTWTRNSTYPTGNTVTGCTSLFSNYDTVTVDILLTWTSASGRLRTRELIGVFGKGTGGSAANPVP